MISKEAYLLGSKKSTIRELFEYGKQAADKFGKENVFDFSLGNPSVSPPDLLTQTSIKILTDSYPCEIHGYTSAQGLFKTRAAIADDMNKRYAANLSPERIYITCGAAASLSITLRALVSSSEDEILAFAPYFPEYKVFVEGAGATFKAVPADLINFEINFTELEKMITPKTKAVIVNSPNNPSGVILSKNTLIKLSELLQIKSAEYRHEIYVISDEPYREISYGKEVLYIPHIYRNTVICYSYSKSLSLPGERIGYIAVPECVSNASELYFAVCGAARAIGYVCAPSFIQRVIAECAELTSDFSVYKENGDILYSALTSYGYECVKPEGAFYLFVKAPNGDSVSFCEEAKKKNLLVVPSEDFGCNGYLRIAYCVSTDMIKRSLTVFEEIIKSFKG